jgi:hypothetical protein
MASCCGTPNSITHTPSCLVGMTPIVVGVPPVPPVPCGFPKLSETEPVSFITGLCTADGRPVSLVYAPGKPDNVPCPPVAGLPVMPGYIGWIDVSVDPSVLNTGNPPVGLRTCGEHFDFELAGIWCVVNAAGDLVAPFSVVWELQRDESTGAIIGGQWVTPPNGTPFVPSATQFVKRCPTVELDQVAVPETIYCANGISYVKRTTRTVDNATGLATVELVEWSSDGTTWSTTKPIGVKPGECPDVKYERFEGCYIHNGVSYYGIRFAKWDTALDILVTVAITDPDGTSAPTMAWPSFTTDCCC